MPQPIVRMTNISKRFGSIQALKEAGFEAYTGEIQVILGENGAGKSSLMSVLVGLYSPDQGEIFVNGNRVTVTTPRDGLRMGIALVPQHVELVQRLTVWENVILGDDSAGWLVSRRRSRGAVAELIERYGLGLNPDAPISQLSAGQQQKVEILKMLYRQARILILDEPTTFLTPQESDALYKTLTGLAQEGLAVLVVTHKLRDAMTFSQRLTVMRGGRVVARVMAGEADESQLIQWLMGTDEESSRRLMEAPPLHDLSEQAPVLLEVTDLSTGGGQRVRVEGVDLRVRQGEIHGIAGIAGSGQRELAEALLGLIPQRSGSVRLNGQEITSWSVGRRLASGLFLVPEDRIHDATLPAMPLYENVVLGLHREVFPGMAYRPDSARALANAAIAEYEIKAPNAEVPVAYLSGGNMQKVIVARAVQHAGRHKPALVVAANPTRGLDVRTVRLVHDRLREIAAGGGAVMLLSEDLDELMAECHTISVIYQGKVVGRFVGPDYDRYTLGEAMLGQRREEAGAR